MKSRMKKSARLMSLFISTFKIGFREKTVFWGFRRASDDRMKLAYGGPFDKGPFDDHFIGI